jgi:hypothetical protein
MVQLVQEVHEEMIPHFMEHQVQQDQLDLLDLQV